MKTLTDSQSPDFPPKRGEHLPQRVQFHQYLIKIHSFRVGIHLPSAVIAPYWGERGAFRVDTGPKSEEQGPQRLDSDQRSVESRVPPSVHGA